MAGEGALLLGGAGATRVLPASARASLGALLDAASACLGVPAALIVLSCGGRPVPASGVGPSAVVVRASLRLLGGKGGFGALLKGTKAKRR